MGRSLTNSLNMQYAIEETENLGSAGIGVLPGSPIWRILEPNTIGTFAASISSVARDPISKLRQRQKGTVTDLDSSAEFEADLTISHILDFSEGFFFSTFTTVYNEKDPDFTGVTAPSTYTVTNTPVGGVFTRSLIFVRGFTASAVNNGFKEVASVTATTIVVTATDLVTETTPTNAELEVAGFRTAAGDLDVDTNGNLTTTSLDFTTLGLTVGQFIWIGGDASINRFSTVANLGYARVTAIATNLLTIDKKQTTFVLEANAAQEVDIYFGRFLRNVPVDDPIFLERTFQFELTYAGLSETIPGNPMHEYSLGNFANQMAINMPLTDKATISFAFIGIDTEPPVETANRKTNAATPIFPTRTSAFNTTSDLARLRVALVDETGLTSDFKSLTVTLNNNVSPEKILGKLGAKFVNAGNFDVNVESQALFTDARIAAAVRDFTTLTMDFAVVNDNGGIYYDIPSLTLGGGDREFPIDESILINLNGEAFSDPVLNTSISMSLFPFLPAIASA